jgi:hypothetical protein
MGQAHPFSVGSPVWSETSESRKSRTLARTDFIAVLAGAVRDLETPNVLVAWLAID